MEAFFLAAALVAVLVWLFAVMPQPERDAAAAHAWAEFARSATDHDLSMLYIENVYDRAYRGSKAVVSLYGDGPSASNDAWFWWEHVQPGSVVAVRLSKGWGSHTRRDGVLYIGNGGTTDQSGIYATFGARELTQAQRHFQQQGIAGP